MVLVVVRSAQPTHIERLRIVVVVPIDFDRATHFARLLDQ
jgi:hypothetical protein